MDDKLKHKIIDYLNKEYSGLVRYETDRCPDFVSFMKDGKFIFMYDKKDGFVYISYDKIWLFLESFFGLEYSEIQTLTKEWVEELFKMEVTTTQEFRNSGKDLVEELFKMEVTTTKPSKKIRSGRWRNNSN